MIPILGLIERIQSSEDGASNDNRSPYPLAT